MIRRQDVSVPCCKLLAAALLALSGLTACGSQMDDIKVDDSRDPPLAPAGIYEGRMESSSGSGLDEDVVAFLDMTKDNERLLVFTKDGELVVGGVPTVIGSTSLSWTARMYRPGTETDEEGEETPITVVTPLGGLGSFIPGKSLTLNYNTSADFGTLMLTYKKARYEQRSNLASLAGTWGVKDEVGLPSSSYTISQDGQINGRDSETACTYQGSLAIIDLHYNLYRLTLSQLCGNTTVTAYGLATLNQTPDAALTIEGVAMATGSATVFRLNPI